MTLEVKCKKICKYHFLSFIFLFYPQIIKDIQGLKKNYLKLMTVFAILVFNVPDADAQAIEEVTFKYYEFFPRGPNDNLQRLIWNASLLQRDGQTFAGRADWRIYVKYYLRMERGRCSISYHDVRVTATVTLPKMVGGTSDQKTRFSQYLSRLTQHELKHVSITKVHANNLYNRLSIASSEANCQLLREKISTLTNEYIGYARAENKGYDERTRHGRTEGAFIK